MGLGRVWKKPAMLDDSRTCQKKKMNHESDELCEQYWIQLRGE